MIISDHWRLIIRIRIVLNAIATQAPRAKVPMIKNRNNILININKIQLMKVWFFFNVQQERIIGKKKSKA